jgi:hypothetical protein
LPCFSINGSDADVDWVAASQPLGIGELRQFVLEDDLSLHGDGEGPELLRFYLDTLPFRPVGPANVRVARWFSFTLLSPCQFIPKPSKNIVSRLQRDLLLPSDRLRSIQNRK